MRLPLEALADRLTSEQQAEACEELRRHVQFATKVNEAAAAVLDDEEVSTKPFLDNLRIYEARVASLGYIQLLELRASAKKLFDDHFERTQIAVEAAVKSRQQVVFSAGQAVSQATALNESVLSQLEARRAAAESEASGLRNVSLEHCYKHTPPIIFTVAKVLTVMLSIFVLVKVPTVMRYWSSNQIVFCVIAVSFIIFIFLGIAQLRYRDVAALLEKKALEEYKTAFDQVRKWEATEISQLRSQQAEAEQAVRTAEESLRTLQEIRARL